MPKMRLFRMWRGGSTLRRVSFIGGEGYTRRGIRQTRTSIFASVVVGEDVPLPSVLGVAPVARATAALRGIPVIVVEAGPPHAIWARVEIMGAASPKLVAATLAALKR